MAPHESEPSAAAPAPAQAPAQAPPRLVAPQAAPRTYTILYRNVALFAYWHVAGLYGLYLCFTSAKWQTIALGAVWYVMGMLGIIAGAHRLWSHRSYKVKLPLEVILMLFNSIGFQNTATDWVRNHRLHHKYSDTDADPHNAARGFFFSHIGWLFVKKHEEVKKRGKSIYMDDIYNNRVLRFQRTYAVPLIGLVCFVLPTVLPVCCWGERLHTAWNVCLLRYCLNMHGTFLTNSAAHKFGNRPYDKNIQPTQNLAATVATLGEGFHNYHHTFSWDYRAAELGNNILNPTTWFIDLFSKIGWAYDLKVTSDDMIQARMARSGDGTNSWGWGDKDMTREEKDSAIIVHPKI